MRYKITPPVKDGEAWYFIIDTQSTIMENFQLVQISIYCPNASKIVDAICSALNTGEIYASKKC